MPIRPATAAERKVFEIWRESSPADAYVAGLKEYAGKVLIPSRENIDALRRQIGETRNLCENESQSKLLACIDTFLAILEPANVASGILETFFGHMMKEGIKPPHLASLADYGGRALQSYLEANKGRDWPLGQRLLAVIRCDGLLGILDVVKAQTKSKQLNTKIDELAAQVKEFETHVRVEGFGKGTFDEVWKIIRERGCSLERQGVYAQALRDLYDYPESPAEVEEKGLQFLRDELGDYDRLVQELANQLGCEARSESVSRTLKEKKSLKPEKTIQFINKVRKLIVKIVNRRVVGVNPKYFTKVMETPPYLSGMLPSGAAYFLDYLTLRPKQLFLATTDPRRDPHTVPAELINLLVHEEYGHCLHSSNSSRMYGAKPAFAEMLGSTLGSAVSEGISFQRELEFLEHLNWMLDGKDLAREEKAFVKFCEAYGGFETICREYELYTKTWRMTRFLRVIGDARINSGKQDLADFVEWANKETGLSRSMVYFQVFPAHQGIGPGYATTYAIIGESIREIQKDAKSAGKDFIKFNTYASSLGFPPRTVFETKLKQYATS